MYIQDTKEFMRKRQCKQGRLDQMQDAGCHYKGVGCPAGWNKLLYSQSWEVKGPSMQCPGCAAQNTVIKSISWTLWMVRVVGVLPVSL
jgi:hypothetical protein